MALFASVVGRQTAGRVMPARWAMREADFEVLLHLVERLSDEQRAALERALASASGEPEAVRLIEGAFAAAPRCPHCAAARLQRWGHASGLRRYRCAACGATAARPLPQDLQRPDRHLAGPAAREGVL